MSHLLRLLRFLRYTLPMTTHREPLGLLTVQEAARLLRLSDDTVRRQIREGTLRAIHVRTTPTGRKQYRIPAQAIDEILGHAPPPDPFETLREAFSGLSDEERETLIAEAIAWARERTPAPTGPFGRALTREEIAARLSPRAKAWLAAPETAEDSENQ